MCGFNSGLSSQLYARHKDPLCCINRERKKARGASSSSWSLSYHTPKMTTSKQKGLDDGSVRGRLPQCIDTSLDLGAQFVVCSSGLSG